MSDKNRRHFGGELILGQLAIEKQLRAQSPDLIRRLGGNEIAAGQNRNIGGLRIADIGITAAGDGGDTGS